jgi:hypothetical protein
MGESRNPSQRITSGMALAGLSLALGIVFLSLAYVIPFMDLFIVVFIPFLGALVALKGDYKTQLIYLALVICVSFVDIQEGFFEYLPDTLIGLAYGDAAKKWGMSFFSFFIMLTVSFLIQIGIIYPIDFFYQVDMVSVFASIFSLTKADFLPFWPLFAFFLSGIESLICFIVISNEMGKLDKMPEQRKMDDFIFAVSADSFFIALFCLGHYFASWLEYLSLGYILLLGCIQISLSFRADKKYFIIIYLFTAILSLVSAALVFAYLKEDRVSLSLLTIGIALVCLSLFMLKYNQVHKPEAKPQEEQIDLLRK